ncbi:MAG: DUF4301 family protein [Bacteroidia bacterium]|nr:DUF4301 family protein [Bacteroidia bacterium]
MATDIHTLLTEQDLAQIQERGSDLAVVNQQIQNFITGFPFMNIVKAATINDGMIKLDEESIKEMVEKYDQKINDLKLVKFVPASGAASRMFKALFACLSSYDGTDEAWNKIQEENGLVKKFFDGLEDFAFFPELNAKLDGKASEHLANKELTPILKALLDEDQMGYGQLPKGLLSFHSYIDGTRTPVEEHLVEGASYAAAVGGDAYLHFTVSPEHKPKFEELMNKVQGTYEGNYNVKFHIDYSIQKPSTDTIAVDMENNPFRLGSGKLLFRPGGHGALIENLNEIDADIVFIKNIDNVVPDRIKADTITYKKALAGVLLNVQEQVFAYQSKLEGEVSKETLIEVSAFLESTLCVVPPEGYYESWGEDQMLTYLKEKLDRPVRVCGMVKNEGEPGGGPFWTRNSDGTVSLQIVESAQIDKQNEEQLAIMKNSTHFNPVDLVCAQRDRHGNKVDLLKFRDEKTGFIAYKSKEGRELKAQELPGLWNGAMANWNTLFVEVPIITFNPVKTVNDLLRPNHQPS